MTTHRDLDPPGDPLEADPAEDDRQLVPSVHDSAVSTRWSAAETLARALGTANVTTERSVRDDVGD